MSGGLRSGGFIESRLPVSVCYSVDKACSGLPVLKEAHNEQAFGELGLGRSIP